MWVITHNRNYLVPLSNRNIDNHYFLSYLVVKQEHTPPPSLFSLQFFIDFYPFLSSPLSPYLWPPPFSSWRTSATNFSPSWPLLSLFNWSPSPLHPFYFPLSSPFKLKYPWHRFLPFSFLKSFTRSPSPSRPHFICFTLFLSPPLFFLCPPPWFNTFRRWS